MCQKDLHTSFWAASYAGQRMNERVTRRYHSDGTAPVVQPEDVATRVAPAPVRRAQASLRHSYFMSKVDFQVIDDPRAKALFE